VHEGAQVEIGGNDRYVAMCRRHFKEALAGDLVVRPDSPPPSQP
jgi:thymidine kinase